jgi:hypothetical protein
MPYIDPILGCRANQSSILFQYLQGLGPALPPFLRGRLDGEPETSRTTRTPKLSQNRHRIAQNRSDFHSAWLSGCAWVLSSITFKRLSTLRPPQNDGHVRSWATRHPRRDRPIFSILAGPGQEAILQDMSKSLQEFRAIFQYNTCRDSNQSFGGALTVRLSEKMPYIFPMTRRKPLELGLGGPLSDVFVNS